MLDTHTRQHLMNVVHRLLNNLCAVENRDDD